jgi:MFS family permease
MSELQPATASTTGDLGQAYVCPPSVLFGMCIGVSIYWLFALSMGPLLPSIARELGLGAADPNLALAMSLAGLTAGICIMPAGGLADRFGRVRLTRLGLAVGLAGALLCGLATSIGPLIAGRFLLGLSAALVMPATLGLVKVYYNDADRPRALSYWSMSTFGCASVSSIFGASSRPMWAGGGRSCSRCPASRSRSCCSARRLSGRCPAAPPSHSTGSASRCSSSACWR